MKKTFITLCLSMIAFFSCDQEEAKFQASISNLSFSENCSVTATKTMTTVITNSTSVTGSVSWDFSETTAVSGWTYTIIIDGNTQSITSGEFNLTANTSATVSVEFKANGNEGSGSANIRFMNGNESIGIVNYTINASATPLPPNFAISSTSDTNSAMASLNLEYKTVFTNLSSDSLEFTWKRIESPGIPEDWSITSCDYITCWAPSVTTKTGKIPGNFVFDFKTDITPNGQTGSGQITTLFFEPSDSAGTVQIHTIDHTAF